MSAAPAEPAAPDFASLRGSATPRLFTPPLVTGEPGPCGCGCALTRETSYGFAVDDFARHVLGQPLDPWQRWLVIHAGELLEDGRPRFRKVLTIVARQVGKTHLLVILSLYWLFVDQVGMVLGTSTQIKYARESWLKVVKAIKATPALRDHLPPTRNEGIRQANGEQEVAVMRAPRGLGDAEDVGRYLIATANEEGGRSLTVDRAVLDELRQHYDYAAWDAIVPTTNAVRDAQVWAISNQGSDRSLVLNDLRAAALKFVDTGKGDRRLGMFEWSAPQGAAPDDVSALLQAVPAIGYRQDLESLVADGQAAALAGGKKLAGFLTEIMCQRVRNLDPAIDAAAWLKALDIDDMSAVRSRVAMCLDVSLDAQHATLAAAAVLDDGRVRVEIVKAWSGVGCTVDVARELPGLIAGMKVRPRALGWFPSGPAASVTAGLKKRPGWPPRGVKVEAIRGEAAAVCMSFAEAVERRVPVDPDDPDGETVAAPAVAHSADPLLDAHVAVAEWTRSGDRKVFTRRVAAGDDAPDAEAVGQIDALYAAAGAAHLARSLPRRVGSTRGFVAREPGERTASTTEQHEHNAPHDAPSD